MSSRISGLAGIGDVQQVRATPTHITFTGVSGQVRIRICSPRIVQITLLPTPTYTQAERIIIPEKEWPPTPFEWTRGDAGRIETDDLIVEVKGKPFDLTFRDKRDDALLTGVQDGCVLCGENPDAGGLIPVGAAFAVEPEEHFYGLGDGGEGFDRRGMLRTIWTDHIRRVGSDIAVPLVLSTRGYGLFFHNPYKAAIDISDGIGLTYRAEGGALDFYFLYGPSMDDVIGNYYELIGYPPLLPRWAFGYQQSSRHFMNTQEILDLPQTLRARGIPCDHLTFLSTYSRIHGRQQGWDGGQAHLCFNPWLWPDPQAIIDAIKAQHFHIMLHQYPQIGRDAADYAEFERRGLGIKAPDGSPMAYGGHASGRDTWHSAYVDFTDPRTRAWWWGKHKPFFAMGVDSWWNDGGEGPNAGDLYDGSYRKCHNVHDLFRDRLLYDEIRKEFRHRRELCA